MKTILLTRSSEDNLEIKIFLDNYPIFSPIFCPLISYQTLPFDFSLLHGYTDVIVTSKYAASIIASRLKSNFKYWVVGEHSAAILAEAGHKVVYTAQNVENLSNKLPPASLSNFAYLSGNEITKELPVKRFILYNVEYAGNLSPESVKLMGRGIDYIVIYSQNTAKTLVTLFIQYNLLNILKKTTIIAISSKVADGLKTYCDRVIYCEDGNARKMMELLINDATR